MKVIAISNIAEASTAFAEAKKLGYITFIYDHADPEHRLAANKFSYVSSDEELLEKINLLQLDISVQEEVSRW